MSDPRDVYQYHVLNLAELLASEAHLRAYVDYNNLLRRERQPDDPAQSYAAMRDVFQSFADDERLVFAFTFVYDAHGAEVEAGSEDSSPYGKLIAVMMLAAAFWEDNRHAMSADIDVHPDYRQQGIATHLLPGLHHFSVQHARSTIFTKTYSTVPAGDIVAEKLGATLGMRSRINQLVLSEVSPSLLEAWTQHPALEGFSLGFWNALYDYDDPEGSAALITVMNTAPREDMELDDTVFTPETLRKDQAALEKRGDTAWTVYARHTASGELAGFSTVVLPARSPSIVQQYGTGVLPKYRGHRLGKALKARMLQRIVQDYPQGRCIRTENAGTNAQMLAINEMLGFRTYLETCTWQLATDTLARVIDSRERLGEGAAI